MSVCFGGGINWKLGFVQYKNTNHAENKKNELPTQGILPSFVFFFRWPQYIHCWSAELRRSICVPGCTLLHATRELVSFSPPHDLKLLCCGSLANQLSGHFYYDSDDLCVLYNTYSYTSLLTLSTILSPWISWARVHSLCAHVQYTSALWFDLRLSSDIQREVQG